MALGGVDLYDLLARRSDLLDVLATGDHTKPELVERLDVSRSTVDRALRELEAEHLVTRTGREIRLTTRGGFIVDLNRYVTDISTTIDQVTEHLRQVPVEHRPHYAVFADATVVTAEDAAPHRPVSAFEDELSTVEGLASISMTVIPTLVERIKDKVLDGGLEVDMVVSEPVLERLVTGHREALNDTIDREEVTLNQTDSELPYDLVVLDHGGTRSALVLFHGDGGISALVQSTAPDAVAWAEDVFQRERARAEPV